MANHTAHLLIVSRLIATIKTALQLGQTQVRSDLISYVISKDDVLDDIRLVSTISALWLYSCITENPISILQVKPQILGSLLKPQLYLLMMVSLH